MWCFRDKLSRRQELRGRARSKTRLTSLHSLRTEQCATKHVAANIRLNLQAIGLQKLLQVPRELSCCRGWFVPARVSRGGFSWPGTGVAHSRDVFHVQLLEFNTFNV